MTSDLDIYRSANELIKQFGDAADIEAAMRADERLPEAGTYLEHAIARLNIEEVCHECYHERLGYCLPKPDR